MIDKLEDFISNDPVIQERARAFNYFYIQSICSSNIYEAFNNLIKRPLNQTLRTAHSLRTTFKEMGVTEHEIKRGTFNSKTGFLTVDINSKVKFLWRAHFLEVVSLNPNEPFLSFSKKGDGKVYIGLKWERGKPNKADPQYDLLDKEETGEEYLKKEFNSKMSSEISFKDEYCTTDLFKIVWQCVLCMILEDPNEKKPFFSILRELAPQIVPDVVIQYINFIMTKPNPYKNKDSSNMVAETLGVDLKILSDDTPLYNKPILQYLSEEFHQPNPKREDLLPTGIIGLALAAKKLDQPIKKKKTVKTDE